MDQYERIILALREYFGACRAKQLFLHGGCYFLANLLVHRISCAHLVINRQEEHCATLIGNGVYDITGRISKKGFRIATDRDVSFMRKNYKPHFDVFKLEHYLDGKIG